MASRRSQTHLELHLARRRQHGGSVDVHVGEGNSQLVVHLAVQLGEGLPGEHEVSGGRKEKASVNAVALQVGVLGVGAHVEGEHL